jgi:hypothetical protein
MSPTSFSATSFTSSSSGTKEKAIPQASSSSSPRTSWMNSAQSTPTPPYANKRLIARALHIIGELPSPLTISILSICNFIAHP